MQNQQVSSINQSVNGICKAPLTKLDSGAGQLQ